MKCLPTTKIPQADGVGIHDWHAEVLAIRTFNRFLLEQCRRLTTGLPSEYLRWRRDDERNAGDGAWHDQPFAWNGEVSLHMYLSLIHI